MLHHPSIHSFRVKIKRGSYLPGWCPPASLRSIKRGLGTERARLDTFRGFATEHARRGTFRGFGTERARQGTFRGFGTERVRLGTLRGFGTERARLGTFKKNIKKMLFFYSKRAKPRAKDEV